MAKNYWDKRIEKLNEEIFKDSDIYVRELRKFYDEEINVIQEKIYNHLLKLKDEAGGISLFEAKKILNDKELESFKMDLNDFMTKSKGNITKGIEKELNIVSRRVRISRLQAMEVELKKTVASLMTREEKGLFAHLGRTYEKRYYKELYELQRITGYRSVQGINKDKLKLILNNPWTSDGKEFSERIWGRGNKLSASLKDSLMRDIARGSSPKESIKNIEKEFGVSKANAARLVYTETSAISSKATLDSYKKLGVKKYEILATLDLKTSDICRSMDSRIFDAKDYRIGITAPPFHPNCYDKETEVLTNNGWKYFKDLKNDDLVYTLNPNTKIPKWQMPINLIIYRYKGMMVKYLSDRFDLLVTQNHNMLVQNMDSSIKNKDYKLRQACDIGIKSKNRIPCGIDWIGENKKTIELAGKKLDIKTYLKFMAYWLSDGSVTKDKGAYRTKIAQCDNDWMWNELKKLPFKKYKCKESILIESNELGKILAKFGKCNEKYIPKNIKSLNRELIIFFLNEYAKCDGAIKKGKFWKGYQFKDSTSFFTSSNQLAADLGELILKAGGRPSYSLKKCAGKKVKFSNGTYILNYDVWTIFWNKQTYSWICYMDVDKSFYYDDFVYCVEVPKYNTLYVRRNGKCCWSGNCRTTTVPYFDDDIQKEISNTRMARDIKTGKSVRIEDISYKQWHDKYVVKKYAKGYNKEERIFGKDFDFINLKDIKLLDISKVNPDEIELIYENQNGGYIGTANSRKINYFLRNEMQGQLSDYDRQTCEALSNVISKNSINKNIKLVRYVDGEFIEKTFNMELGFENEDYIDCVKLVNKNYLNSIISDKGFISASWDPSKNLFIDREVKLTILAKKGTNMYLTKNLLESEIILGPSDFRVINCELLYSSYKKPQINLILEVIDDGI